MGKHISRRKFLKMAGYAGMAAGMSAVVPWKLGARDVYAFAQSTKKIRKFVTTLPGLGPSGANNIGQYIPLAVKRSIKFAGQATDLYDIAVTKYSERMHPDLPGKTDLFGYSDLFNGDRKYLGGAIVAKRGTPVLLTVTNLHAAKTHPAGGPHHHGRPERADGRRPADEPHCYPSAWRVHAVVQRRNAVPVVFAHGKARFELHERARHCPRSPAPGPTTTRTSRAPGCSGTMTTPSASRGSMPMPGSPRRTSSLTTSRSAWSARDSFPISSGIPLVIQDKGFVPANILYQDPDLEMGRPGRPLVSPCDMKPNVLPPYPPGTVNPKGRWDYGATVDPPSQSLAGPLPPLSIVPEAFFDTILINGGIYPQVNVPAEAGAVPDAERLPGAVLSSEPVR